MKIIKNWMFTFPRRLVRTDVIVLAYVVFFPFIITSDIKGETAIAMFGEIVCRIVVWTILLTIWLMMYMLLPIKSICTIMDRIFSKSNL